jgi:lysyl-tRNA synthetase class 2
MPSRPTDDTWRPTATPQARRARARLYQAARAFFADREVLEVDTPVLSAAATQDVALASWRAAGPGSLAGYLNTSPEFSMKRLLAAGSGDIFQIGHVFRADELGPWHNPEFTLLEWYRLGFDDQRLMQEVEAFIFAMAAVDANWCRPESTVERVSYRELFVARLGVDPLRANAQDLAAVADALGIAFTGELDRDGWLDALMALHIIPSFPAGRLTFVHHFPESQAILARLDPDHPGYARRFELFWGGVELANGFHELTSVATLDERIGRDREKRLAAGLPLPPVDERFRAAMVAGLPECAGVALGLDRLLMCVLDAHNIADVLDFPWGTS